MAEPEKPTDFDPARVNTYSRWRLRNHSQQVDESEFRKRFATTADEANDVFDAFLSRLRRDTEDRG